MRSLEGSFRNLTSILLNFFFIFIDIKCFFLKFKTTVPSNNRFLNKLKLLNLFFKSDDGHAISLQEKRGCPKALRDFPPRKVGILHSRSGCLGTSLPLPQSLYGRTLTSQAKFFGSIDYQISLAMELRWQALPADSAIKLNNNSFWW